MAEVEVGDIMQVWLDYAGFEGRVGEVVKIDKKGIHHLRLGGGELVRLNLENRTAQIHGVGRTRPLKYTVTKRPQESMKRTRFKRTTSV